MSLRFESGVEFIMGYRLMERLGSGGFGEVWKCEAPGGIFKAVKIIHGDLRSQNDDMIRYAEQELKAMKRVKAVRHPYLLAIDRYDIVEGRLLIVMELADCNLWDRFRQCRLNGLPGIQRDEMLTWMLEAAEVLDLMNFEHQLLHLDIKPQNMFLQYNHVKVGDFGQVKDLEGIMASVTGGITPVYAAPETFDGIVTRYCDQYSLACVYQELLTGTRPFDGSSLQQLMMQHLTNPPNLAPSPPADRAALAKALAKKPEDRFANCLEFVRAMKQGTPVISPIPAPTRHDVTIPWGTGVKPTPDVSLVENQGSTGNSSVVTFATTGLTTTPLPEQLAEAQPSRIAPDDVVGNGPLRPALIIGLGATGLRILQQFRKQVADRFGTADATPAVRTLLIDTDPETVAAALSERSWEGLTAFKPDEVYAARLNRATHYMKPRATGRTLIEGWFDPKWLHLLPRNPLTQGLRPFGRLALHDHYRALIQKIDADLDTILTPEALQTTIEATHLELGTNRPRIYLAASLAGGTGSGMILDLAYILRNKLRKLGYAEADVVGLLMLPPDDAEFESQPTARGNVYAALTELHHYSHAETFFQAYYDDRHAFIRDSEPPFKEVFLLPATAGALPPLTPLSVGTPGRNSWHQGRSSGLKQIDVTRMTSSGTTKSGPQRATLRVLDEGAATVTRDSSAAAADWLRLNLFGPFGRTLQQVRTHSAAGSHVTVGTFGLVRYEWPRTEVVTRTARVVTGVMLNQWVSPDPGRAREVVPTWTANLWSKLGLDMDGFIEKLRFAADQTVGTCAETLLAQSCETALPKGWLNRTPDAAQVAHVLVKLEQFIGHPVASTSRTPTAIEEATRIAASDLATAAQAEIASAVPRLIDDPQFRLAGAEEAARQLLADLTRMGTAMNAQADRLDEESLIDYDALTGHAHATRSNRSQGSQLSDALRKYPKLRFQSVLARRAARTYTALKELLTTVKNEMANCRQRLLGLRAALMAEIDIVSPGPAPHQVMPPGCFTIEDAAKRYLDVLTDDDLHQIEVWVQAGIERHYGGLYQACLNTTEGAAGLLNVLRDETRAYLNARLGDVDLAAMFEQKFGSATGMLEAFHTAYDEAAPTLVGNGPWTRSALNLFTAPAGDPGESLRHAAFEAFPEPQTVAFAETPDETVIYREYPDLPLAALAHFGPMWQNAYDTAAEVLQCSPHTRTDIAPWKGVDS